MKCKEITMYELIGLVKDDKAPKQIKYQDTIYEYDKYINGYFNKDGYNLFYLVMNRHILNDTVEIIEENDEWEEISTIKITKGEKIVIEGRNSIKKVFKLLCDNQEKLIIVMNKIIKNQKYLKGIVDNDE